MEEALNQARTELSPSHDAQIQGLATERFNAQVPELEAKLAAHRAEVDAMQEELNKARAAVEASLVPEQAQADA